MNEKKQKVFVIDDDKAMLKNAALLLSSYYSVSLYSSGNDALGALLSGDIPDIILLDVNMPDKNGYEVIKDIRNLPECARVPVIFVTGLTDEEDELHGFQLGADDYIKKPFSQKVLLARIAVQIQKSQQNISINQNRNRLDELKERFTDAENKTAEMIVKGYSGKEIAESLYYSYSYVKKLLASMKIKCNCETLGELKRYLSGE